MDQMFEQPFHFSDRGSIYYSLSIKHVKYKLNFTRAFMAPEPKGVTSTWDERGTNRHYLDHKIVAYYNKIREKMCLEKCRDFYEISVTAEQLECHDFCSEYVKN